MSVIETMIDIPAEHEKNVCGQFDTYLKKIERTLHVTMIARDGEIKIIAVSYTHLDVYKRQAYEGCHGVCGDGRI